MVYLFLAVAIGLFVVGIKVSGVVHRVKLVVSETNDAFLVMNSVDTSEDDKEAAVKAAAIRMFGSFWSILLRVIVICLIPVGFAIFGAKLGFYSMDELLRVSTDWYFIIVSSFVMVFVLFFVK